MEHSCVRADERVHMTCIRRKAIPYHHSGLRPDVRLGQAFDLGNEFKITDHLPVDKCSRIILSPYVSTGGANGEQARFKAHIARRREQTEIGTKPAAGQAYD